MVTRGKGNAVEKAIRRGNPMIRTIVPRDVEAKLRARAAKERRTLSQMCALILTRYAEHDC